MPPEQALHSFQLEPGLAIELAAAEPLVVDPVAMAFDEHGRLYVAENRDYPTGPDPGLPPGGQIALLVDTDGDGQFEKRTTFADRLTFPNGLMPWKGGLLVTCAPDLLYLKDTNGDGVADIREVWFTGFDDTKTSQLRVSHPTLGPDNWIYLANALAGGSVRSLQHPSLPPVEMKSDLRFRPSSHLFEPADGRAQFGMAFDDFGHRFICYNRVHVQHVVLPARYLRRNPHLAFSETVQDAPQIMLAEPLKGHGASARIYPISQNVTTADSHAGTFTAACSVFVYRTLPTSNSAAEPAQAGTEAALPLEYLGNVFAADPTGNLVHRDRLQPRGATFSASRVLDGIEFAASRDNWFRPVFLTSGPDGALYICDMYRRTIEHPQYLPEAIRARTDFASGKGLGRIYRVTRAPAATRKNRKAQPGAVSFPADATALVELLRHPNAWWRDTAHRLLLEQSNPASVPALRALVRGSAHHAATARFHALHLLDHLTALDDESLQFALRDPAAGVRDLAIRLAEPRLGSHSELLSALLTLARDTNARVRFQCALTLGESNDSRVIPALAEIVSRDAGDKWTRAAVLSSVRPPSLPHFVEALGSHSMTQVTPGLLEVWNELGRISGASLPDSTLASLIQAVANWRSPEIRHGQFAFVSGALAARRLRSPNPELPFHLDSLRPANDLSAAQLQSHIATLVDQSQHDASNSDLSSQRRACAISFLAHFPNTQTEQTLISLLNPLTPAPLQIAAIRALTQTPAPSVARALLNPDRWSSFTPQIQENVISALLSSRPLATEMLTLLETKSLPLNAVTPHYRAQFLRHPDEALRARARALFEKPQERDRQKAFEQARSVLALRPNPRHGQQVFAAHCANCHRLDRQGIPVGPDLFSIRNQPKESILLHIIIPELEIVPGFAGYIVETRDGRSFNGLIASETETSLTLRNASGIDENLLRSEIAQISASSFSLMPQGFENAMSQQDLADLLAYLKGE